MSLREEERDDVGSESEKTMNQSDTSGEEQIAFRETTVVNRSKWLVYFVLTVAATVVGTVTYRFVDRQQGHDFATEYYAFANEVVELAEMSAKAKFAQVRSLSVAMTSYTDSVGLAWPLITLPDFEHRTQPIRDLTGAQLVAFAPIVNKEDLAAWEEYSVANQGWIEEGRAVLGLEVADDVGIPERVYQFGTAQKGLRLDSFLPLWQMGAPPRNSTIVNADLLSLESFHRTTARAFTSRQPVLSEIVDSSFLLDVTNDNVQPRSYILEPVMESFEDNAPIGGFLVVVVPWDTYFQNTLPQGANGFIVEVNDSCGSEFTYVINGPKGTLVGEGDLHDQKYDNYRFRSNFTFATKEQGDFSVFVDCQYTLDVFPSDALRAKYDDNKPIVYTCAILLVFVFTAVVFALYDFAVYRRQRKVLHTAERTSAIVSSLFPKNVKKRLMEDTDERSTGKNRGFFNTQKKRTMQDDFFGAGNDPTRGRPIADLFPEATIMFADIVGFTAWSSAREPTQVFTLLETIYSAFDEIAKRRRIFKVETVGDCYVAVAGIPDPRKDHAVACSRFAHECLIQMQVLTKELECTMGPDTTALCMRIGLHTGPVTAGVLRGEKSRFQLFGDTVNTTARMESNGKPNKIQVSEELADSLIVAGKRHWLVRREDLIEAKGKGQLQTFWLEMSDDTGVSTSISTDEEANDVVDLVTAVAADDEGPGGDNLVEAPVLCEKHQRLVHWNTDVLQKLLRQIAASRQSQSSETQPIPALHSNGKILEEIQEVIELPMFDASKQTGGQERVFNLPDLDPIVVEQLRDFVRTIALMYPNHPFHNFEHASHVTMSTSKLLSRIVAPKRDNQDARHMHDHTYGITSDPLTQFAVVFAGLVHDVDHPGVPNAQLIAENHRLAAVYHKQSMAEQNSVDLAWNLLMDDDDEDDSGYAELRRAIYSTPTELQRFRHLVVNAVMATDVFDPELNSLRKDRWNRAFAESHPTQYNSREDSNRKATIVIEHLIQASDVSHTMQHWKIFTKWNSRLFEEVYTAHKEGRSKDPSLGWYEGELSFFDNYIIPLAKKLKECGVFGVSSDEYLNYAVSNRREWAEKGKSLVSSWIENLGNEKET